VVFEREGGREWIRGENGRECLTQFEPRAENEGGAGRIQLHLSSGRKKGKRFWGQHKKVEEKEKAGK